MSENHHVRLIVDGDRVVDVEPAEVWEVLPDMRWHRIFRPVELIARKREGGRWIYREPTSAEVCDYLSRDAW